MISRTNSIKFARAVVWSMIMLLSIASHGVTIGFDSNLYQVSAGNQIQLVTVLSEPVPNGLEGYAIKLYFPQEAATISTSDISVPTELDFDFLDPGADRQVGTGFASVAGYVEVGMPAYNGTQFAVFNLTIPANASLGSYTIDLGPLLLAGDNFVDGTGTPLDDSIQFGSTTLEILPPPPTKVVDDLAIEIIDGDAHLTFTGSAGWYYTILFSEDLSSEWIPLSNEQAPANGIIQFIDARSHNGKRFYIVDDGVD